MDILLKDSFDHQSSSNKISENKLFADLELDLQLIGTSPDLRRIKLCVQGQDQIMMQCKNDFGFWNDIKVSTWNGNKARAYRDAKTVQKRTLHYECLPLECM